MSSRRVEGKDYRYHRHYRTAIWVTESAVTCWRECDKPSTYTNQLTTVRSSDLLSRSRSKTNTAFIRTEISLIFIAQIIRPLQSLFFFSNFMLMLSSNVPNFFFHRSIFSLLSVIIKILFAFLFLVRIRFQKFPAWHTKAAPNGKCCEGYIVPSMVRLMYQLRSVLK